MNFRRIFLVKCLLVLFPGVKCSVTKRIYMAVNESALLSVTGAGGIYDATWQRDQKRLLQIKDNIVKYYVTRDQCRCTVFLNGTLQIERVVKEDSGKYTVTVYHPDGKLKVEEDTMFIVQEPVPVPVISAECINKTVSVKCQVQQKSKDETFIIELTYDKGKKTQKNATKLELQTRYSGTFRCTVRNEVSKKTAEKVIKCSGLPDLYLILSITGGTIFFVIFIILLIYCIRKKKAERLEDNDEERMAQVCQMDSEMAVRELPRPPCNPTMKQLRVQQRPLPQPQVQQQALPPRPRPRTQQQTPNHPRERP
ncbi:T-cell surface antigen CD2 [Egretta garzetta]|uniref:T-cell surface antigen CD2 n=1 Tax=Egretta garzetta TaxID=188379 RepID=UPI00051F008B|nr:T-cell surface antigen CD2 [Egretta garzetta]